jgi:hypothetical protein
VTRGLYERFYRDKGNNIAAWLTTDRRIKKRLEALGRNASRGFAIGCCIAVRLFDTCDAFSTRRIMNNEPT